MAETKTAATKTKTKAATKDKTSSETKTKTESKDATATDAGSGKETESSASDAPKGYSRGENQKLVTDAYRENWAAIFGKKPGGRSKK